MNMKLFNLVDNVTKYVELIHKEFKNCHIDIHWSTTQRYYAIIDICEYDEKCKSVRGLIRRDTIYDGYVYTNTYLSIDFGNGKISNNRPFYSDIKQNKIRLY